MKSAARARVWRDALTALETLLYTRDPEGMGESVGAPHDEYADVAARLLREVTRKPAESSSHDVVADVLPTAWPGLVDEILTICVHFERIIGESK